MHNLTPQARRRSIAGPWIALLGMALTLVAGAASAQTTGTTISQSPLSVGGNVPGNLLLVPSVEWPTLDSMANLGAYDITRAYVGYFDANKCYRYSYNIIETSRYFYPVRADVTSRICSADNKEWSGNYLNWATTQTIDPFRKALTGGYRVRDTSSETWVEKARFDGNGANSIFPNRRIPASGSDRTLVEGATPAAKATDLTIRIWQLGNKMRFTRNGDLNSATVVAYDPLIHTSIQANTVYEVSVRVKVCDSSVKVESNCIQYSSGWKPEGLIQKYSERIRYSVFGYLNDDDMLRDGGVLRARQKFVGEYKVDPTTSAPVANTNREWDPSTGVLVRNPDPTDATSTGARVGQAISDSGVINYINKFGQMTTKNHKSYDPVSELYYTAIRYLKKQGNVPEYTNLSGTSSERYTDADGFPVITDWDDPMQYSCQNNALLGIGDVNTHRDKNLPGNSVTTDEPTRPATVTADTTVNVVTATRKVAQLEGITIPTPFTGRENSAYMAGLAYEAHTKDLRSDLEKKQTVSTYWVDVRENQVLEPRSYNQYWLAAKYGGFTVPENFDPDARTTALESGLWNSGDVLATGDARPENFYVASEADKMMESLTRAFAKIAAESAGSSSALAANSTRLDTDTRTFQAQFFSPAWRGELRSFVVQKDGSLKATPEWSAHANLLAAKPAARPIYFYNPQGDATTKHGLFLWSNLTSSQKTALDDKTAKDGEDVLNYLRGDRSKEEANGGNYRTRTGVLGDIVNSTPTYVGAPNARLYASASFTGASAYAVFASNQKNRTAAVYVGANDGMLHGFNATTGDETYAFVPNTVILNGLRSYSDPTYEHRYFVDGEVAVSDVYDTSTSSWKTVLVGTLGRGGPGVFALDVTNPTGVKLLWEKSGTDIPALGKNIGRPVIAQVANGDWRVLLGNGLASTAGAAQLVTIGIRTGTVTVANTGVTGTNGLSAVLARDSNGDSFADAAYAGDRRGNLWKFTGLSGTPTVTKIFEARDPSGVVQPITAAPLVGKDPDTGSVWVFFGTGSYLTPNDLSDRQVQSWYGLKDAFTGIGSRSDLVDRDIISETKKGSLDVRVVEDGAVGDLVGRRGWFMDLAPPTGTAQGERMVVPNRFQGVALIGTTRIPEAANPCSPTGKGFIMAINPFTGARLDESFFDVTRDGVFDNADLEMVDKKQVPVSGIGFGSSSNNPIFIENTMQVSLDPGTTETIKVQGSSSDAGRMGWREIVN